VEFGLRRAQGVDGALRPPVQHSLAAHRHFQHPRRKDLRIPFAAPWLIRGHGISSERAAFDAYAESYPDGSILLIDTYDNTLTVWKTR